MLTMLSHDFFFYYHFKIKCVLHRSSKSFYIQCDDLLHWFQIYSNNKTKSLQAIHLRGIHNTRGSIHFTILFLFYIKRVRVEKITDILSIASDRKTFNIITYFHCNVFFFFTL